MFWKLFACAALWVVFLGVNAAWVDPERHTAKLIDVPCVTVLPKD